MWRQEKLLWRSNWSISEQIFHLLCFQEVSPMFVLSPAFPFPFLTLVIPVSNSDNAKRILSFISLTSFLVRCNCIYVMILILSSSLNYEEWLNMQPKLIAVSNPVSFKNPKAPLFPRLAHGKLWNEVSRSISSNFFSFYCGKLPIGDTKKSIMACSWATLCQNLISFLSTSPCSYGGQYENFMS